MPGPDRELWFMRSYDGKQDLVGLFGQITVRGSIHMSHWVESRSAG